MVLEYVKNQTEEIYKLAIQNNKLARIYINLEQINTNNKLIVETNGLLLEFIEFQTDEICKLAVQANGLALKYVKNQTDEICNLAVQENKLALQYVKNPNNHDLVVSDSDSILDTTELLNDIDSLD
jgi:hypothetical protein